MQEYTDEPDNGQALTSGQVAKRTNTWTKQTRGNNIHSYFPNLNHMSPDELIEAFSPICRSNRLEHHLVAAEYPTRIIHKATACIDRYNHAGPRRFWYRRWVNVPIYSAGAIPT